MSVQVVAAFTGTGKSHFAQTDSTISDADAAQFDKQYFPGNYMAYIRNRIVQDKATLVSTHDIVREALGRNKIPYVLVYPSLECKDEYLARFTRRGSEPKFISILEQNWEDWINECMQQEDAIHVQLKPGQYLEDVIEHKDGEFHVRKPEPVDAVSMESLVERATNWLEENPTAVPDFIPVGDGSVILAGNEAAENIREALLEHTQNNNIRVHVTADDTALARVMFAATEEAMKRTRDSE